MDSANLFIYYYNINVAALVKYLALYKIFASIFDNVLNVVTTTFLRTKFAKDLILCLS